MSSPLILIVGDDTVAEAVCRELVAGNERVRVVYQLDAAGADRFRRTGASVTIGDPNSNEALHEAGVAEAAVILTLSDNDELNLGIALRARILNPRIRVILRQFSQKIGRKIEQNLRDATVMSLAIHSAATYAGAALDPGCYFALQFPETNGALVGFTSVNAQDLGVAGLTVAAAEDKLLARILTLDGDLHPDHNVLIRPDEHLVIFGEILERQDESTRERTREPYPVRRFFVRIWRGIVGLNPIVRAIVLGAIAFYAATLLFFHFELHESWDLAAIDVAEVTSNAGYGDTVAARLGPGITLTTILVMFGGTIFTSIFIGSVSAWINRAQWVTLQGLRRVRARDHVVVCGGGRTGGTVVNLLVAAGKRVIVIDARPDPGLVRRARSGEIDLLTGDATHEDVLDLCNIPHASSVVALTNSDTGNLEIALGARALRPDVPLVVRMESRTFSQASSELFSIATFSPAELSAPALAGLARFPGTLGRVSYGGRDHTLVCRMLEKDGDAADLPDSEPLCVWRRGSLIVARYTGALRKGDIVLFAVSRRPTTRPPERPTLGLAV
jgi:Trk K+ transport system NAD-binding subunit